MINTPPRIANVPSESSRIPHDPIRNDPMAADGLI